MIVSEAPKVAVATKKFPSYNPDVKSDEQKKEEVGCCQASYYYTEYDFKLHFSF